MARKRYDVVAVTGTYTDRQGNERRRYLNCGAVFETEKGLSLKLEAIPVGSEGWFMLFEPRPQDREESSRRQETADEEFQDDIPF